MVPHFEHRLAGERSSPAAKPRSGDGQ